MFVLNLYNCMLWYLSKYKLISVSFAIDYLNLVYSSDEVTLILMSNKLIYHEVTWYLCDHVPFELTLLLIGILSCLDLDNFYLSEYYVMMISISSAAMYLCIDCCKVYYGNYIYNSFVYCLLFHSTILSRVGVMWWMLQLLIDEHELCIFVPPTSYNASSTVE